ncbi:DUF based on E rectale Gene description, partial [Dysosmobacter welbionis]
AVEIQILPIVLQGDARALDMPPRIPYAPGGIPLQGLVLELALGEPEDEVVLVALVGILLHALPDAYGQVLLVVVVEDVVPPQLGGVEVHVAAGEVGIAGIHQLGDDLDILVDAAGGGLDHIRRLDIQPAAVLKEGIGVELGDLHDRLVLPLGALEHLVLALIGVGGQVAHVGDVHHPVDIIASPAEELLQHVLHDITAQVADVG